jgi:hypothetical protein
MSRKKKEEKKMPFIVATYVYASSQGQSTHSARTKNGKQIWRTPLAPGGSLFFFRKIEKCLKLPEMVRKLIRNFPNFF